MVPLTPQTVQAFSQNPQVATQLFRSLMGPIQQQATSSPLIQMLANQGQNQNLMAQSLQGFSQFSPMVSNFSAGVPAIPVPQQGETFEQAIQRMYNRPSVLELLLQRLFKQQ